MPTTSKAQFRMMFLLYKKKKITKKQLVEFTHGVKYSSLPAKKRAGKKQRLARKSSK